MASVRNRLLGNREKDGTPTQRQATNTVNTLTTNEQILQDVYNIYMDNNLGLCKIAKLLDLEVKVPRRKITILLIGNHSAGKSSFINWYIEETVLKTGVAIETQGFCFVVSGKKRETLKGQATLQLFPHLKPLQGMEGVVDFLSTEVSSSRAKKFCLVNFIDTPGLVDGGMHYPYDVNEALMWMGDIADLVMVFFDPMGQALCKRTLNIVENLWRNHSDKVRLYLAKADEAGTETDRQKVLMQIVQELCKRPGLNRTGFEMPTIFLPDSTSKPTKCANQIDEVCRVIESVINQTVQNSLNNLRADCIAFRAKMDDALIVHEDARSRNRQRFFRSLTFGGLGVLLPILLFVSIIVANSTRDSMFNHLGSATDIVRAVTNPLATLWKTIPAAYHLQMIIAVVCVSGGLLIFSRFHPNEETMPSWKSKMIKAAKVVVSSAEERCETMYGLYLRESLTDEDVQTYQ